MTKYTPYLQLRDRLSQIWINKYTLLLIIAFFKILLFYLSIGKELSLCKQYILSHCDTIDSIYGNLTTNTPHYLGLLGNYLIDKALEESVKATLELLSLLVYASEELITFVIDLYLGTYACLIVSAIDGTVDVATNTTEKLIGVVNDTVSSFANDLDDGLDDISKVINKIISAVSKVEDFFTDDDNGDSESDASNNISKVNLTISALRNVYIPSSINDKLEELSAKTPDFATVKNDTKKLISEPFQLIRNEIKSVNTSNILGNSDSILYVPPKDESMVGNNNTGICSSNKPTIDQMFTDTTKSLKIVTIVLLILIIVGALVVLIPEAWREIKQWKRLKQLQLNCVSEYYDNNYSYTDDESDDNHLKYTKTENSNYEDDERFPSDEPMDVIESYQRCFQNWQTRIADGIVYLLTKGNSGKCSVVQRRKIQWFAAYITSERVLFVLTIGLLGLLVSIFQLIILHILKKEIHKVHTLGANVMKSSEVQTMKKDLTTWTKQTNLYINQTETNINTQIFGWVETSTTSINTTVTGMISGIDTTLADVFNGTLLYHPMTTVVKCVIEDKLYAVEKAMTWIHDKAQLKLPQINSTEVISLVSNTYNNSSYNNATSSSTTSLSQRSVMETFTNEIHTMLTTILNGFHHTAIYELIISCAITGIWVLQIPIALLILICRNGK